MDNETTCRILVVDDEPAQVRQARVKLTALGFEVTTFDDPQIALDAFVADPDAFHCVVADQSMPSLTGVELTKHILAKRPHMPVFICSGYGIASEADTTDTGVRQVLWKPVDWNHLAQLICEATSRQ